MPHSSPWRTGRVTDRDAATCRVRVAFGSADALVSYWLPVMQDATLGDRSYRMPAVDEHVVCLLDERGEFGVVLGAIYSSADAPPIASLDRVHVAFVDGTSIDYDREAHTLELNVASGGRVLVTADRVELGTSGGDQLVTKAWLTDVFAAHVHTTSSGPSGPPTLGAMAAVPNVTDKVRAT